MHVLFLPSNRNAVWVSCVALCISVPITYIDIFPSNYAMHFVQITYIQHFIKVSVPCNSGRMLVFFCLFESTASCLKACYVFWTSRNRLSGTHAWHCCIKEMHVMCFGQDEIVYLLNKNMHVLYFEQNTIL